MKDNEMKVGFRTAGRLLAVQGLFMMASSGDLLGKVVKDLHHIVQQSEMEYIDEKFCDFELMESLIKGALENQSEIDPIIIQYLPEGWNIKNIDNVVRAILRSSLYEVLIFKKTPIPILLKEYMNISSSFGLNHNKDMVGGLLNKVVHDRNLLEKKIDCN